MNHSPSRLAALLSFALLALAGSPASAGARVNCVNKTTKANMSCYLVTSSNIGESCKAAKKLFYTGNFNPGCLSSSNVAVCCDPSAIPPNVPESVGSCLAGFADLSTNASVCSAACKKCKNTAGKLDKGWCSCS